MEASQVLIRPRPRTGWANRQSSAGWPAWCVPCWHLARFIEENETLLKAEATPVFLDNPKNGRDLSVTQHTPNDWTALLNHRVSAKLAMEYRAVVRRMYAVRTLESNVVNTAFADAIALSVGKHLDETNIPSLPGSVESAKDLIRCRAEAHGIELAELDVRRLARQVQRVGWLIVTYPEKTERLLDHAPLDSLRAYR